MDIKSIDFTKIPVQANIISDIINLDIESSDYLRKLDDFISSDQGVASLVLRVVNSPRDPMVNTGETVCLLPESPGRAGLHPYPNTVTVVPVAGARWARRAGRAKAAGTGVSRRNSITSSVPIGNPRAYSRSTTNV